MIELGGFPSVLNRLSVTLWDSFPEFIRAAQVSACPHITIDIVAGLPKELGGLGKISTDAACGRIRAAEAEASHTVVQIARFSIKFHRLSFGRSPISTIVAFAIKIAKDKAARTIAQVTRLSGGLNTLRMTPADACDHLEYFTPRQPRQAKRQRQRCDDYNFTPIFSLIHNTRESRKYCTHYAERKPHTKPHSNSREYFIGRISPSAAMLKCSINR